MRLTPHRVMQTLRVGGISAGVAAVIALAGPFRYEDLNLPFPDTVAHAALFYGVTLAMLTSLPKARANEVATASGYNASIAVSGTTVTATVSGSVSYAFGGAGFPSSMTATATASVQRGVFSGG